ncbi:MAG: FkbM family methyltransferase [Verrucomicrobiota bacterium]|nr:FkbM family methyltransferase [Verrucomicrobiota bacterium]
MTRTFTQIVRNRLRHLLGRPTYTAPNEVEREEHRFYLDFLKEGMVVFDVGANYGDMTALFSKLVGSTGHIHSFEPVQLTFDRLSEICRWKHLTNATVNRNAVSQLEGSATMTLYGDDLAALNSLCDRPLELDGITITEKRHEAIETVSIDGYCKRNGIEHIHLLKIDVEGAEYQVFQGAREMLRRKAISACIFEFGGATFDMGNEPSQIEKFLHETGYSVKNVVRGDPVFPGGQSRATAQFSMQLAVPQ